MHYDIIIIGGGPAGTAAGLILSKFNKSICLIDKNFFPRPKVCAGIITEKTVRILKELLPKFDFDTYYRSCKISLFSQSNSECEFSVKYPLTLVDREQFDYELLLACKNIGINVFEGITFSEFIPNRNTLILKDKTELTYNILIAADGIFSQIRQKLGIADIQKGFCIQNNIYKFQCNSILANMDKVCFDFANVSYGYNWVLPNKNNIIIGTGIMIEKTTYEQVLVEHKNLCNRYGISSSMNQRGGFLPIGDLAKQSEHPYENIILIGDAAGFANPITGEGIYYALLSGYYAGIAYQRDKMHYRSMYLSLISSFTSTIQEVVQLSKHFYSDKMINNLVYQLKNCPDYISNICDDVFNLEQRSYQDFFCELTELFR
ncbi:MAG: NAD(P)/FAD-dependent oxidoreductase [Lachnospiraceae bacterium]|nr:NAD(P)/FAD-dependent oxidoreductase [Lachnospiraceae bacterium]